MKYGIYTIAVGDYAKEYAKLCMPSQKAYAEAVGAAHYMLDEKDMKPEYPTAHFLLWEAMKQFLDSDHERFLFIDADIIIQKGTPNIFDEFEEGQMYMRRAHSFEKIEKWVIESRKNGSWPSDDTFDPVGKMTNYFSSGAVLADRAQVEGFLEVAKPPFVIGPWNGEMAHYNYFIAKGNIPIADMDPRWHYTRSWADGYKGKSLQSASVDKLEDIYFMHYAVPGNKLVAIHSDKHIYGDLSYGAPEDESHSNVNIGMVLLSSKQLSAPIMNTRLDIEDNIGESIHIHYKNFRFDFTVKDFIELAKSMDQSLTKYASIMENV